MKALIITSQSELSLFANLFINSTDSNIEFYEANSLSDSVELLSQSNEFEIIFIGHKIIKDMDLSKLAQGLIPFINEGKAKIYGTNHAFKGKKFAKYYNRLYPMSKILLDICSDFNLKMQKDEEHISFPLISLMEFEKYPFDCLVKDSSGKFIEVFQEGEEVDVGDILTQKDSSGDLIYISTKIIEEKIRILEIALSIEQNNSCKLNPKQSFIDATEYTLDILKASGIEVPEGAHLANSTNFKSALELSKIYNHKSNLKKLFTKDSSFYVKHVSMTSIVCQCLLKESGLYEERNVKKLLAAANFQNIFLKSDSECYVYEESQIDRFEEVERNRILYHAELAYKLLSKNPLFDPDVLTIIREQHGKTNSGGYPEVLVGKTKLSIIFQMATLFSQMYLISLVKYGEVDVQKILSYMKPKFSSRHYKTLEQLNKFN